jgi:hypothetical protein
MEYIFSAINICENFRRESTFHEGVGYEMVSGKLMLKEE